MCIRDRYVGRVEKLLAHYSQIPLCFVNLNGKITRASSKIAEVFKYDGIIGRDIFELTRIRPAELIEAAQNETNLYLDSNDKSFKILSEFIGEGETASIMMSFIDVTRMKCSRICTTTRRHVSQSST